MLEEDKPNEHILEQARVLLRAALFVSNMDDKGGNSSTQQERKGIIETLRRFEREQDYKPLREVFELALENHKAWTGWGSNLSDFTEELRKVAKDMPLVYRQCIYDLAYCVATRYRERNWISAIFASIRVSFLNFLSPRELRIDLPAYLNISPLERSALNELADILDLPRKILK